MNTITNVVIRNIDASLIFNMSQYIVDKDKKSYKSTKEMKTDYQSLLDKIENEKDDNKRKVLVEQKDMAYKMLNSMANKDCIFSNKDSRYFYKGTLSDSLMLDELLLYTKASDFRKVNVAKTPTYYTDIVINLKFNENIMIKTNSKKYKFNDDINNFDETGNEHNAFLSNNELRELLYEEGFFLNGKKYVNFQRSSSKSRTGNDLFILEKLHCRNIAEKMIAWQRINIKFADLQDIVSVRAYETLTSSAVIDKIFIDPDSILLIDDVTGKCTKKCNVVEVETYKTTYKRKGKECTRNNKRLVVNPREFDIKTDLWDGQSLLDKSCFTGKLKDKGFALLRNHYAKTAAFSTDLSGYFKYRGKDKLEDRFGDIFDADKIRMVTTKNSMKIFKFTDDVLATFFPNKLYELNQIENKTERKLKKEHLVWTWYKKHMLKIWGICKYEKESKYQEYQQLAYQMINSLNLSLNDILDLATPSINHVSLINKYPAFFKNYLGTKEKDDAKSTMMIKLMEVNDAIIKTKWYKDYRKSQVDSLKKRLKCGKILIKNNDYAILFGNGYEMLRAAVGDKIEFSLHNGFECWCPKFKEDEKLTGFRSPHILESNSALLTNKKHDEFNWFNLTDNIIMVNFFSDGAILSNIWNGADTDSDSVLLGNTPTLLKAVEEAQDKLVPINNVPQQSKIMEFTPINLAKVDAQLSNDYIGRICNLAQQLQSLYYHLKRNNGSQKVLDEIFSDLNLLEVLSNIAIDSAKRRYDCSIKNELTRIRKRDYLTEEGVIIEGKSVKITKERYKNISESKKNEYVKMKDQLDEWWKVVNDPDDDTTDEEFNEAKREIEIIKAKMKSITTVAYDVIMKPNFFKDIQKKNKSKRNIYMKLDTPMDILGDLVNKTIKSADRKDFIWICDILKDVPYDDADINRINTIKEEAVIAKKIIDELYSKQSAGNLSWDKLYEEKQSIERNITERYQKLSKITIIDISRLIRDVYDFKYKLDKNGNRVKDQDNNPIIERDKRDQKLIESKAGGYMLQWVYDAFPELFISAIKSNSGRTSYLVEDENGQFEDLDKRYSIVECEYTESNSEEKTA